MRVLLFLVVLLFFNACNKLPKDRGIIISDYDVSSCFLFSSYDQVGIVIVNQSELDSINNLYSCSMPNINFGNQILMIYLDDLPGSGFELQTVVENIESKNKYVFKLYAKTGSSHLPSNQLAIVGVIVPKPPSFYTYEFETIILK